MLKYLNIFIKQFSKWQPAAILKFIRSHTWCQWYFWQGRVC